MPLDAEDPAGGVRGLDGLDDRAGLGMDGVQVPAHRCQRGRHDLHGLVVAAVHQEDILAQEGPQAGPRGQLHPVVHVRVVCVPMLVPGGLAAEVVRDVLDEAAPQGHVQDLLAPAGAEDGQLPLPHRPHQGNLQGVAGAVHIRPGVHGFGGVPVAGVNVVTAREQEAGGGVQVREWVPRGQQGHGSFPASCSDGRKIILLCARLAFTAHQED